MALDAADCKESSFPVSSQGSNEEMVERIDTKESRTRSGNTESEGNKAETGLALQHIRTLGKLRFRPADDDEPQWVEW